MAINVIEGREMLVPGQPEREARLWHPLAGQPWVIPSHPLAPAFTPSPPAREGVTLLLCEVSPPTFVVKPMLYAKQLLDDTFFPPITSLS